MVREKTYIVNRGLVTMDDVMLEEFPSTNLTKIEIEQSYTPTTLGIRQPYNGALFQTHTKLGIYSDSESDKHNH